ncbi:hypothetical protein [Streptomyces sp. NPDC002788]
MPFGAVPASGDVERVDPEPVRRPLEVGYGRQEARRLQGSRRTRVL